MLQLLKDSSPNLYIIIIALGISLWFEGMNNILSHFIKERNLYTGFALCFIALLIFYSDDGSLNELYNINDQNNNARAAAAISAMKREY